MSETMHAVELPRRIWRVTGDSPLAFLEATTSQSLLELRPGEGALTCVLDDKGHVLAELRVLVFAGHVLLDGEGDVSYLERVAPLSGCSVEPTDLRVHAVRGDRSSPLGPPLPAGERAHLTRDDGSIVVRVEWAVPGFDIIGSRSSAKGSLAEHDAARIAAGRPVYGVDVTADMLINETPYLARAVSFTKGCYPGQESVARVHNLGRVRRLVVGVRGAEIATGPLDDDVGRVTSAAGGSGIAYVRAEALEKGCARQDGNEVELRAL
ncbi:MAG: folate-binding protein YgfZ [Actinomycetota bacterium]